MFSEQETRIWQLTKRSNRLCKFGYTDMTLIVGLTIKFVDSDATLKNLLLVCRDFNDILKPTILKQSLLRADQHRINEKRRYLWLHTLKIDPIEVREEFAAL